MIEFRTVNIVALFSILISLLLSSFLLTVKTKNKLANSLLASFIILCAIDISGLFINQYLKLFLFTKTFTFLIFPSFFLYALSICYSNFRIKYKHLLHIIPFIVYNLILFIYFFIERNDLTAYFLQKSEWIFNAVFLKLQALFYIIAIIHILKRYKKIYIENYAVGDILIYKWLYQIILIFSFTLPITIAKELLFFDDFQYILSWINIILVAIALFMLCWFVLKALYNPELFRGIDSELQTTGKIQKQETAKLTEVETEQNIEITSQIEQLKRYMVEQEPYLEPILTLQDLASQVNITSRELSILINRHIGQHFFDFINEYRIKKSMEILKNSSKKEFTIQQILYDVGFNSKSSFNTAFKKHIGLTPTEYINRYL